MGSLDIIIVLKCVFFSKSVSIDIQTVYEENIKLLIAIELMFNSCS